MRTVLVAGVDPDAVGVGHAKRWTRTARRQEAGGDVLGVETGLDAWPDRVADRTDVRERLALGDAQLQLDQVEARDQLGDGVLDLQPGVHLEEEELPVAVEDELDGAGADVADRGRPAATAAAHSASRSSGPTAGDGASSMIFWWRRWIEHSRSKRWTTLPWVSPKTCTSTCRGRST